MEMHPSATRIAWEPIAFTIDHNVAPFFRASSMAANVSCLAGLRDCQHHRSSFQNRITITEFGCNHHFNRNACNVLNQVFSNHSSIRSRTTGGDEDLLFACFLFVQVQTWQNDPVIFIINSSAQRIRQRTDLFMDFLLHEMAIFAFFCRNRVLVRLEHQLQSGFLRSCKENHLV